MTPKQPKRRRNVKLLAKRIEAIHMGKFDVGWNSGFLIALAEVHRIDRNSSAVCEVARSAGLTIKDGKLAGLDKYDLDELKRAGIK